MDARIDPGPENMSSKFTDEFLPKFMQLTLHSFILKEDLYDVVLETNGRQFKAHKIILSAFSQFFKEMFRHKEFKENKENLVRLDTVEPVALEAIIWFIYSSSIEINKENVFPLMAAVDFLGITTLRPCIEMFLKNNLSYSTLKIVEMAETYQYEDLREEAWYYCLGNFASNPDFTASLERMKQIIASNYFRVLDERYVLKIVVDWVKFDSAKRIGFLSPLLQLIKVEEPRKFMLSYFEEPDNWLDNPNSWKYIQNGVKEKRCCSESEVIVVIGGENGQRLLRCAECLLLTNYESWSHSLQYGEVDSNCLAMQCMQVARCKPAVASNKFYFYAIGGADEKGKVLTSCEEFHANSNKWRFLPELPEPLLRPAAALCNGQLYVSGGPNSTQLYVLNLTAENSAWRISADLCLSRSQHCMVSALGYLYIIGGVVGNEKSPTNMVWRFDTVHSSLMQMASMGESRAQFGAALIDSYIYVMGGRNDTKYLRSVERYDIFKNQWLPMRPMFFPKASFGVTVSQKKISVLGGEDEFDFKAGYERYNPLSNSWHCKTNMNMSRSGLGAATFKLYHFEEKTNNKAWPMVSVK